MRFISYEMLMDEIAVMPDIRKQRATAAVEAVIRYGGATRGQNNWCGYWHTENEYVLYYQSDCIKKCSVALADYPHCQKCEDVYAPCRINRALERYCRCKCDFLRVVPRNGFDNLYLAAFGDWNSEILETYGLF